MAENGIEDVMPVRKDVGGDFDYVSPIVRLMGKRPQSISGCTFSITTFRAK